MSDHSGKPLLYESKKQADNSWTSPAPIDAINSINNTFTSICDPSYNIDASTVLFAAKHSDSSGYDIYCSQRSGDSWLAPAALSEINTGFDETSPSMSPNNSKIFFCRSLPPRQAPYKAGCKQMLYCDKNSSGSWQTPMILHSMIQSDCDADTKIATDGKTMFFSSYRREESEGEWDIYYTRFYTQGMCLLPVAIDSINTKASETQPVYVASEKRLYYLRSNRKGSSILFTNAKQSYSPLATLAVKGKVTQKRTSTPIPASVDIFNAETNQLMGSSVCDGNGAYYLMLEPGKNYHIDIHYRNHSHHIFKIQAKSIAKDSTIEKDAVLFDNINLKLNIVDDELFDPIDCLFEVYANSEPSKPKIKRLYQGCYSINLDLGIKYKIVLHDFAYSTDTITFDLTDIIQYDDFELDVELKPLKVDINLTLVDQNTGDSLSFPIVVTNKDKNEIITMNGPNKGKGKYTIKVRKSDTYEISSTQNDGYFYMSQTVNMAEHTGGMGEKAKIAIAGRRHTSVREMETLGYLYMNDMLQEYESLDKKDTAAINKWKQKVRMQKTGYIEIGPDGSSFMYVDQNLNDLTLAIESPLSITSTITPITYNKAFEMKHIFFETNSYTLLTSSFEELDKLMGFLNQNAGIKIQISAHTDDVGENEYNFRLSELRAATVANYLMSEGLDRQRIRSLGMGETSPVARNDSEENRAKNRRVEFKVIQ